MKRILSAIFLLIGIALAGSLLAADTHSPSVFLPDVVSVSGHQINDLYMVILAIVTVIFVITEGLLLYSLIAFRDRPGHKAQYFHGSTAVELVLAGVPVLILLYLTMVSSSLWNDLKLQEHHGQGCLADPGHGRAVLLEFPLRRQGRGLRHGG